MHSSTSPETKPDIPDSSEARALLREAFAKTARWPQEFKGFSAAVTVNVNGKEFRGSVTVKGPRDAKATLPDGEVQAWTEAQLGMIAVHRGYRTFEESDGKHILTMGNDAEHPLGRKVYIHGDGMQSFYRIKDGRITQINRKPPQTAFTINVEESARTQDEKFITTRYTVYYYSPQDGALTNVDSFTDSHVRLGGAELPATRRIISFAHGEVIVKTLIFSQHTLL